MRATRVVIFGVVVGVGLTVAAWTTMFNRQAPSGTVSSARVTGHREPVILDSDAPPGHSAIPGPLAPASSRVLATFTARSGKSAEVLEGLVPDKTRKCVELRTIDFIAMSCWPAQSTDGVMHVQRSTYHADVFVTGTAPAGVARIVGTRPDGSEVAIPVKGGAFFTEERSALELQATDANGRTLDTAHVNGPDPDEG